MAHLTRDHLRNQCTTCSKTVMRLERVPKRETSLRKTPWT